jgi:hypothetical protein
MVRLAPPSICKVGPCVSTIGCDDDVGVNVICLVQYQGLPSSSTGPGPRLLMYPLPLIVMRLVSTLSSGGAIATVLATGNAIDGASPAAQSHATKPIAHHGYQSRRDVGRIALVLLMEGHAGEGQEKNRHCGKQQ